MKIHMRTTGAAAEVAPSAPALASAPTSIAQERRANGLTAADDEEEDDDSYSETGWTSSEDEDEDEDVIEETEEARQQRTLERIRVLHAAGLLVPAEDDMPAEVASTFPMLVRPKPEVPDRVLKRRKTKKQRPDRPHRGSSTRRVPERPLPAPPAPEETLEDAYDRYVRISKESVMRSSMTGTPTPVLPPLSPNPTSSSPRVGTPDSPQESRTSGFLSTIKSMSRPRVSSAGGGPERRTPIIVSGSISAPMSAGPLSGSTDESSGIGTASGGASWSDLVGPNALEMIPDKERKRQEAIFELILTENSHVRELQIIVQVFFNSMQSLLSSKASAVIFANIEDVLLAAASFLSDLEDRQRENRLYLDSIGDMLKNHMPNMKAYVPYCVNQTTAAEILKSERQRDPKIDAHLVHIRETDPAARQMDLSSFLLIPMQRITRYPLLFQQILRYTEEDHPDHPTVAAALQTAQSLLDTTNEAIRQQETNEQLKKLSENLYIGQARLDLTKPTRFMGPRTILKQDTLAKAKSGRKLQVILCNDMLLLLAVGASDSSAPPQLYHMPMPLEEISVRELVGKLTGKDETGFTLLHHGTASLDANGAAAASSTGAEKINLRCSSPRAAHAWAQRIESARLTAIKAMQTYLA